MDNIDDSEINAKISDSAYSNSCSNSQSRRSHSSTHSGSHSSRSSGYGGKQTICASSKHLGQPKEKRIKDKDGKRKKQFPNDLVQIQAGVEFRLPKPAVTCEVKVSDVLPTSSIEVVDSGRQQDDTIVDRKPCDDVVASNAPQSPLPIVMSKPSSADGFSCVISMHDGVVMYTTASVTMSLGFPKDMLIGRSFIDFIHPLDHSTFASQITSGFATSKKVNSDGMLNGGKCEVQSVERTLSQLRSSGTFVSTMFCRIRRYRGLTTGFGVRDRTFNFIPFMLKLFFKNVNDEQGVVTYLVIQATPLFSAFKTEHEIVVKPVPFVMRHVSNGNLDYIDHESVPMLGYMPQDVTGKDVLRLYHPDDLLYVRQLYETIVKEGGAPRSKPYRLMAQNGHYLKLETEWSSFINPWSQKLECVIGKHHVVEGPGNPDVFQPPVVLKTSDEEKNRAQGLRDSIVRIMNEILTKPAELAKQHVTKRCQDIATFMESLMEEPTNFEQELRLEIQDNETSYYERDSVMLGGISPHHDYNDSKSSTTTPLSYNQLNFKENLQRFFDSHEETLFEEYQNILGDSMAMKDQNTFSGRSMSPMAQQSVDSAELTSSSDSTGAAVGEVSFKPPRLTESLLNKHNSEMEKWLVMQHRECRPTSKENREKASIDKQKKKDHLARCNASFLPTLGSSYTNVETQPHGLKRASKQAEVETQSPKHHCAAPRSSRRRDHAASPPTQLPPNAASASTSQWQPSPAGVNGFMSADISMPQQMSIMTSVAAVPGLIPMYYVPPAAAAMPTSETSEAKNTSHFPVPHLQYMMYGQAVFGSPVVVTPPLAYPVQHSLPPYSTAQGPLRLTTSNYEEVCKPGLVLKPGTSHAIKSWREKRIAAESSGTSPKVMESITNSRINCSTSSDLNRSNEAGLDTPNCIKMKRSGMGNNEEPVDRTDEESSYSSFYSSFFKTESGSAEESGDTKKGKNLYNSELHTQSHENSGDKITTRKREPPWMEQVCVTSELVYKYQVLSKNINEVLTADKQKMFKLQQPPLVNEQLGQLYMDMELEGVAARLTLEEGVTSSGSSGEDNAIISREITKHSRRKREYSKLVMIYEEDAPLPSPCEASGGLDATGDAPPYA